MLYDDEQDILETLVENMNIGKILQLNGSSLEKSLYRSFKNIKHLIAHNSHSDPPPDYYSNIYKIMFDVMRVNDTEVRKNYNPVMIRQRNMENCLKKENLLPDGVKTIYISESQDVSEHSYVKYKRNVQRVMRNHIEKIPIWAHKNENYKKGLLVFDETEICFEGKVVHVMDDQFAFRWNKNKPLIVHEPWNDINFIGQAYESELDFIIWFCPYKPYGKVLLESKVWFPSIVFIDVRYKRNIPYKEYDDEKMAI